MNLLPIKRMERMTSSAVCQWFQFVGVDALLVTAHPRREPRRNGMKSLPHLRVMLGIALLGCRQRDPIDRVVEIASNQMVPSYLFKPIDLAETASPGQLVSALAKRGDLHGPTVMKARDVQMPEGRYTAVLLDTWDGKRVVLLQPMTRKDRFAGWYYKIYETK